MAEKRDIWRRDDALGEEIAVADRGHDGHPLVGILAATGLAVLDLPRLDALIAELTRRRALLSGEHTRTAEDERRDVLAWLAGWRAPIGSSTAELITDISDDLARGHHVGAYKGGA